MTLSEYLKRRNSDEKARHWKRSDSVLSILIITVIAVVIWVWFRADLFKFSSQILSRAGQTEKAEELRSAAQLIEMKNEAEKTFGCEVEKIELPRSHYLEFCGVISEYVPDLVPISYLTTPGDRFITFVPHRSKDRILRDTQNRYDARENESP